MAIATGKLPDQISFTSRHHPLASPRFPALKKVDYPVECGLNMGRNTLEISELGNRSFALNQRLWEVKKVGRMRKV